MNMKKSLLLITLFAGANVVADSKVNVAADAVKTASAAAVKTDLHVSDLDAKLNIRYVSSYDVMGGSQQGQDEGKNLEKKRQKLSEDLLADKKRIEQKAAEFSAKAQTMSEDARSKAERDLRTEEVTFKNKVQESEYELKADMQKVTERLVKDMEEAVIAVAKAEKLDAVVDAATGRVIYVADKLDITDKITKEMNKKHEIKLAANNKKPASNVAVAKKADAKEATVAA
jgi:Skp family chaperone for outer membrane proteins